VALLEQGGLAQSSSRGRFQPQPLCDSVTAGRRRSVFLCEVFFPQRNEQAAICPACLGWKNGSAKTCPLRSAAVQRGSQDSWFRAEAFAGHPATSPTRRGRDSARGPRSGRVPVWWGAARWNQPWSRCGDAVPGRAGSRGGGAAGPPLPLPRASRRPRFAPLYPARA